MSTEDGIPENVESKTLSFINSHAFQEMISCFSNQISSSIVKLNSKPRTVSIYLATDAAGIRQEFAKRLIVATQDKMNEEIKGGDRWIVEVDYFKESLPPAHFFIWTYKMKDVTEV